MGLVDWRLAAATGRRLVPAGPSLEPGPRAALDADLLAKAAAADAHVARLTGLDTGEAATVVVDRRQWVSANVESFADLVDPLLDRVVARRGAMAAAANPLVSVAAGAAAGLEVGVMLSLLATRVLGQFELLGPPPAPDAEPGSPDGVGRLTLVAPNIVTVERELDVDPEDFRLWVCLHEVTHRAQFAAAPWLRAHLRSLLGDYVLGVETDPLALLRRLRRLAVAVVDALRGREGEGLAELVQTPEQRVVLDQLTGVMSLLEGHADVVMDQVGPDVVPSVATIRERFDQRRRDVGPAGRVWRRLLGLDMKMKQYAEGAEFVRAVIDRVGMAGLNVVWTDPRWLPTATEIRDPDAWLRRRGTGELAG